MPDCADLLSALGEDDDVMDQFFADMGKHVKRLGKRFGEQADDNAPVCRQLFHILVCNIIFVSFSVARICINLIGGCDIKQMVAIVEQKNCER